MISLPKSQHAHRKLKRTAKRYSARTKKHFQRAELPDNLSQVSLGQISFDIKQLVRNKAFDKNVPLTMMRGNSIVKIFRSGKVELVKELKPIPQVDLPKVFVIQK